MVEVTVDEKHECLILMDRVMMVSFLDYALQRMNTAGVEEFERLEEVEDSKTSMMACDKKRSEVSRVGLGPEQRVLRARVC